MARVTVRHLVVVAGTAGTARYYWRPSAVLRAAGWRDRRLVDSAGRPIATLEAAMAAAEALNREVDDWREGKPSALEARRAHTAGSVAALIAEYRRSRWWSKLAANTQDHYEPHLRAIEEWAGDQPARAITPPAVQMFYQAQLRRIVGEGRERRVIETPTKAAAAVRILRLLLQVGVRLGYVGENAAARPGISLKRAREPLLWSAAAVPHMAATADAMGWRSIATAILLNEWIGQREADVLALPPWAVEREDLVFRQGKTRRLVSLPVHLVPHLVERLRSEAGRDGAVVSPTTLLLHDNTGRPWLPHTFRHTFAEVRALAAAGGTLPGGQVIQPLPECAGLRFMELRHTAVTRLHEAGVDVLGICGITGHSPKGAQDIIARHYLSRSSKAAARAFRTRLAAEGEEP